MIDFFPIFLYLLTSGDFIVELGDEVSHIYSCLKKELFSRILSFTIRVSTKA